MEIQVHFKGRNVITNLLVVFEDKDNITNKSEVIYRFKCAKAGCEEKYIGESGRSFGDRLKEHIRPPYMNMATPLEIASV